MSNCDSKSIKKALAIRMSKVLDDLIDPNQTAYVNGRSVTDNLRSILFMKDHCVEEGVEAVLISLDAKKAFDSVSHQYTETILKNYGFGPQFIKCFKTLYSRITAKILINGHLSDSIDIERGYKQGDALSCAFFILGIDPLIRNINKDPVIRIVEIRTKMTEKEVNYKAGAYADDVDIICRADRRSVQRVFEKYKKLTLRSGLELNADKTEILALTGRRLTYDVNYCGQKFAISTVKELKICGMWYCNDGEREYELNIMEKIEKLTNKIKLWKSRNLTFEGKSLIIKTFGLSQLIYNLQAYRLKEECIKKIERLIFGFLWVSSRSENDKGIDRIKRSILKNDITEGGLNITDVECLNKSLKLRQFIRAGNSKHPIARIQDYCMEQLGYKNNVILQEYAKITKKEEVTRIAQITINNLCDYTRKVIISNYEQYTGDINAVNYISSTKIDSFLLRENKKLVHCVYIPLRNEGVELLHELCCEEEIERERARLKRIRMVIVNFPSEMMEIAASYDENVNKDSLGLTHTLIKGEEWMEIGKVTTKVLQSTLKIITNKISNQDFDLKLGIINYNKEFIGKFRKQCKNVKLRHIYFRLISKDFFTREKMFKYKMIDNNKCKRCGEVESYKHLLWECREASNIWRVYNEYMTKSKQSTSRILSYEEIFNIGDVGVVSKVKMKVIQEMIQIERPVNWSIENIMKIAKNLKNIELYNSAIVHKLHKTRVQWNFVEDTTDTTEPMTN